MIESDEKLAIFDEFCPPRSSLYQIRIEGYNLAYMKNLFGGIFLTPVPMPMGFFFFVIH